MPCRSAVVYAINDSMSSTWCQLIHNIISVFNRMFQASEICSRQWKPRIKYDFRKPLTSETLFSRFSIKRTCQGHIFTVVFLPRTTFFTIIFSSGFSTKPHVDMANKCKIYHCQSNDVTALGWYPYTLDEFRTLTSALGAAIRQYSTMHISVLRRKVSATNEADTADMGKSQITFAPNVGTVYNHKTLDLHWELCSWTNAE